MVCTAQGKRFLGPVTYLILDGAFQKRLPIFGWEELQLLCLPWNCAVKTLLLLRRVYFLMLFQTLKVLPFHKAITPSFSRYYADSIISGTVFIPFFNCSKRVASQSVLDARIISVSGPDFNI